MTDNTNKFAKLQEPGAPSQSVEAVKNQVANTGAIRDGNYLCHSFITAFYSILNIHFIYLLSYYVMIVGKVGLVGYILFKHSLLGVFCAGEHSGALMKSTGVCCCCVGGNPLNKRHRLMVLLFIIVLSLVLITNLVGMGSADFLYMLITAFVVTPIACVQTSWIQTSRAISARLRPTCFPAESMWGKPLSWAELFIFVVCVYAIYDTVLQEDGLINLKLAAVALVFQWVVTEPATLFYKFFFCSICCPCCVPKHFENENKHIVEKTSQV